MRTRSLRAMIDAYETPDPLESEHRRAMLDLLGHTPEPFSRRQFDPGHVTASSFLVDRDRRVLLHHHRRLGRWLQMGGHVDGEESIEQAAMRESREESGLADLQLVGGILDLDVHEIPASATEPRHRHFDVRFLIRTSTPGEIEVDSRESIELAWFSLEDAARLMDSREANRTLRKIARAFDSFLIP